MLKVQSGVRASAFVVLSIFGGMPGSLWASPTGLFSPNSAEKTDDSAAILALIEQIHGDSFTVRRKATQTLSDRHGEYAIPYLIRSINGDADPEFRLTVISVLSQFSQDAVSPLCAALNSSDITLRRSASIVLGQLGNLRALAPLKKLVENDVDQPTRQIARDAMMNLGGSKNISNSAHDLFCAIGEGLSRKDPQLSSGLESGVLWSFDDPYGLRYLKISPELLMAETARENFAQALVLNPRSNRAASGIVQSYFAQLGETKNNESDAANQAFAQNANLGLLASGIDISTKEGQPLEAATKKVPSANELNMLNEAINMNDKKVRYTAAIALASATTEPDSRLVSILSSAVGEDTSRIVHIIDDNSARSTVMQKQLEKAGYIVVPAEFGAAGLVQLKRSGAGDLVILSTTISDLTTDQILNEIQEDSRTATVGVFLLTDKKNAEKVKAAFGSRVKQVIDSNVLDVNQVTEAVASRENPERTMAEKFASEAATALASFHTEITPAAESLMKAIAKKSDETAIPAARAIANAGRPSDIETLLRLAQDNTRSVALRAAILESIGGISARNQMASIETVKALLDVLKNEKELALRTGAAKALGQIGQIVPADKARVFTDSLAPAFPTPAKPEGGEKAQPNS